MAFPLEAETPEGGWASLDAAARVVTDVYGQKSLALTADRLRPVPPPETLILDVNRP